MVERVNYEAQVNQMPVPYYYPPRGSSKKRVLGMAVAGGLIGMNAYYLPVNKDVFVQRAFDMTRNDAFDDISRLRDIAIEVDKEDVSTESKMILQQMGVAEDRGAIANKCIELENKVTDKGSVKALKDSFATAFDNFKKNTHKMDALCSDAYREVRRNKFRWGVGIGAGIGLALGWMSSRD